MNLAVRGLLHSVTRSKHLITTPKPFSCNVDNHDGMASEGSEEFNTLVREEGNTSTTTSADQFHLLLQVLQSNGKPLLSGNFTG